MPILTEEERLGTLVAGRYRIAGILGRGGTGVVFEATHTWTGRRVAVKLLRPEYARDLGLVRRFLQEARAASGIEHPNVVQVLDMGNEPDGTVYLVLELLEGRSLTRLLEEKGALSPEETLELLVPIMDALVLAHGRGIVHRDLKPDNVFLRCDAQGRTRPKLLDFGMAKMVDAAWGHATQSGTLVGTPFYMSPEQAEGKPDQDAQSDVWSMGVILHRCLTGKLPFHAETPTALLLAIVSQRAPKVRDQAPDVPAPLAAVIDRALIANRGERIHDMRALIEDLRRAAEVSGVPFPALPEPRADEVQEPFDPGPPVHTTPRGRMAPLLGVALAAVLIVAALGYALQREDATDRTRQVIADTPADNVIASPPAPLAPVAPAAAIEPPAEPAAPPPPARERRARSERPSEPAAPAPATESEPASTMRIPSVAQEW